MNEIKWEEPPPPATRGRKGDKYLGFAEALRARPGEWAVVSEDAYPGTVTRISKGHLAGFRPAGAYEARGKALPNSNRIKVWARYVGPVEKPKP